MGWRVLLIEDEVLILLAMEVTVNAWGYEAVAAASGQQAMERLGGAPPHLIVADWRLQDGQTGGDAVQSIRHAFHAEIPALIVTGETAPDRLREIAHWGFRVLHKPVVPLVLQQAIEDSVAGARGA